MGVLTQLVKTEAHAKTLELPGKVVMDPHLGGRVQAMVPGRIEAVGQHGLPAVGSRVRKGEILAWVVPAASQIERSNQMALLAELKANLRVTEKRLARLRELADSVPRKDIEGAQAEVSSLSGRIKAVSGGLNNRDALVVPVSALITGQQGTQLFVVGDSDRVHLKPLTVLRSSDSLAVLGTGIGEGDRVVIDGQVRVTEGARVRVLTP